jgi:hypothetical protein
MAAQEQVASSRQPQSPNLSEEDLSKDIFFQRIAELANDMITAHGRDFAMGALVLGARFIAENKPLTKTEPEAACGCGSHHHHHAHHHSKT